MEEKQAPADSKPRPVRKAASRGRISRRLVITSSAAILAVYTAGFARTQSAADQVAAAASQFRSNQANPTAASATPTTAPATSTRATSDSSGTPAISDDRNSSTTDSRDDSSASISGNSPAGTPVVDGPSPTQPSATTAPASAKTGYRDGTYTGTGTSRHGDISAQVVVKGGKIASAQISACYTRYPCSRISDLPGEVISQQNTNVDMVSGATDSSEAFLQAVDSALQRAMG